MARRLVSGPCAFCGAPAQTTKLISFRVRARVRKPVRVRICRSCEKDLHMGIEQNADQLYTGAASKLVPPITGADCAKYPTFDELVLNENAAGRGATVRHGVAFAKRTPTELAADCSIVCTITGYVAGTRTVTGTGFFDKVGVAKLEVNIGAGWITRATDVWNPTLIHHAAPILVPGNSLRVTNRYGSLSNVWTV